MTCCGAPTFTCVLLLLFLAALYAGASSSENDDHPLNDEEEQRNIVRVARAIKSSGSSRGNKRPSPVGTGSGSLPGSNRKGHGKLGGKKDKKKNKHRTTAAPWGRPNGTGKRPRPGGKKDALPAGISKQMMRLASKIHSASTPFAARLFQALTAKSPRHIVISPFSIHTALTLTMLGARGATEKEMSIALGHRQVGLRKKKPHKGYKALLASLKENHSDFKIYSANGVFVKPGFPLEDSFRQGLIRMYNASFDSFQLQHPQGPEAHINNWVSQVTRDRIKNLVPPRSITPTTQLIIVNAVYFNASWSKPFNPDWTRPTSFYALDNSVQKVDMMSVQTEFGYGNFHNTEIVELLYKGDRLAMYILLPDKASNITQLQQTLASSDEDLSPVDELLDNLQQEKIQLYLPKFKMETETITLNGPLEELGMQKAFQFGQADFSGISANKDLFISSVLHKAFIEVTEKDTEAAAATAVKISVSSAIGQLPPRPKEVKVDRPFMFVIRDKLMKEILFIGTYIGQAQPPVNSNDMGVTMRMLRL